MTEQEQLVAAIGNFLQQNYGDRSPAAMRKLFDRYDRNDDGNIDKRELVQLLDEINIGNSFTRGAWARGIIDKLDTGGDKAITWAEFQAVASAKS